MSIFLYEAVLPKNSPFALPITAKKIPSIETCALKLKVNELILTNAIATADAIINAQYKQFDGLVKNFGCQITALEVFQLISQNIETVKNEAFKIKELCKTILLKIDEADKSEKNLNEMKIKKKLVTFFDSLELSTSKTFAKLVRLRLLCLVNENKPGPQPCVEIPYTDYNKIIELKKESPMSRKSLIDNIQIEEAKEAALFIQNVSLTSEDSARLEFISRILRKTATSKSIVSTPLMYNSEAVLRAFNGILMIKNKLSFCKKPLKERQPIEIFLKCTENKILSFDDLKAYDKKTAILVIEGYIQDQLLLIKTIQSIGIIAIVNANCATLPQYAGSTEKIDDDEAENEIARYAKLENELKIKDTILNIDHFYAASIAEEVGEIK